MGQVTDPFIMLIELWSVFVSFIEPFRCLRIFINIDPVKFNFSFGKFHVHVGA